MTTLHSLTLPDGFLPNEVVLPSRQTAIVQNEQGKPTIYNNVPLPNPDPHIVLVRVAAVSINPSDWKVPARFPSPGAHIGCDFAGTVISIGPEAAQRRSELQPGDRVCGGIHGANPLQHSAGTYAEYIAADWDLLLKLPESVTFTQGAVLGGSVFATLWVALYESLGLSATPDDPIKEDQDRPPVLVYGGSTSTGTTALQILHLSGYKTLTTCSPRNKELVKAYGAEEVFDYRSDTCAADIKASTKGRLRHVLDIITDVPSQLICYQTFGRLGGRYTCLEQPAEELHQRRTIVKDMVVGLAASGKEIALADGYARPANPQLRVNSGRFFQIIQRQIDKGRFKPHPARVLGGGFQGILRGLEMLQNRELSGEKLVVFVDPAAVG